MTVRVWAPRARRVELVIDAGRVPMHAGDRGWFECSHVLEHGADYGFSLDGGPVRPDPRSSWQPNGVHAPSRHVDHAQYAWRDDGWRGFDLASAVLYEVHVGTFSAEGTFDGVAARLGHVVDLGADAVEIMPVAGFSGERGWGYDGVDLYAVHETYGGPEALKRLVDACHHRGLGVVLDVVYNHLGPVGNYLGEFGPYFADRYHAPWGDAVNLDGPGSHEARAFFLDNAVGWLRDYHIDGLRLDAVHALYDFSACHLLEEMAGRVSTLSRAVGRPLYLIAESDLNDPRLVEPPQSGGYGLDAMWVDDLHHAVHSLLTGEVKGYYEDYGTMADLAAALRTGFAYAGRYSRHRDRRHGRAAADLRGRRLVVSLQNHDQVGNRAVGDRLTQSLDARALRVGAGLVLLSPFVPLVFQGEEWGASTPFQYFTDHDDPAVGEAVRVGRRREFAAFGWTPESVPDPQAESTFRDSKLVWAELDGEPHRSLLAWYRELIRLRRRPALADDRLDAATVEFDEQARTIVCTRRGPAGVVVIAANLAALPATLPVREPSLAVLAASDAELRWHEPNLLLPGMSLAVLG